GDEKLFLTDPEINHMFDANVWKDHPEIKRDALILRDSKECMRCHPDPNKKSEPFNLDLFNRRSLDGGPSLRGGAVDPPAPEKDETGRAIDRYLARQKDFQLTPERMLDKDFMQRYNTESDRLRKEDAQRQQIFAHPDDPTIRARTPYDQLSTDQKKIIDD